MKELLAAESRLDFSMIRHFMKAMTASAFALILISGSPAQAPVIQKVSSPASSESEVTSTPDTEKTETLLTKSADFEKAIKNAEKSAIAAKAPTVEPAKVDPAPKATSTPKAVKSTAVPPKPAPAQNFHSWVNATLAKYGVSPGPSAVFRVGNTAFCGGYMCTTVQRIDTTVLSSLTTVSPGAIGNEFALIHEVAHQHGVGYWNTGGECAADVWARQYVSGSIYC